MSPPRAPTTPPRPPKSPSPSVPRPLAVALTGGIAAGKSEALAAFARHGAATLSSDAIVHDLLAHDDAARAAIRKRWGDDAVGDRARIGELVFGTAAELDWLEQLLHPKVVQAQRAWFDELMERDEPPALAVVEIPLLYETGGEERFDAVVVITAPLALRAERRAAFADREARLVPEDEKVRRADFAYVNDGTLDDLDAFVAGVVERLSSS
jgi:dephospho-CoA kinase